MKLNSAAKLALGLLVVGCALCCAPTLAQEAAAGESTDAEQHHSLFQIIASPIKSAYEKVRNFFGHRLGDGSQAIREQTFGLFARMYNKSYPAEQLEKRMSLFFSRKQMIDESVRAFDDGKTLFKMRLNPFVDWDEQELKTLRSVRAPSPSQLTAEERAKLNTSGAAQEPLVRQEQVPREVDWRRTNCVSAPINQLHCGACYAIATVGALESQRCINGKSSPILSPQQIVDCAGERAGYENYGCDGGWPTRVLKYLASSEIVARELCYPFVRREGYCKLRDVKDRAGCTVSSSPTDTRLGYKLMTDEREILQHVATTGPVITAMQASDSFLYFGSGIFDDPSCKNGRSDVDHAIVIVGYGRENDTPYWIIKNSWGVREWGEDGYAKYKRGSNVCSIGHWGWGITS